MTISSIEAFGARLEVSAPNEEAIATIVGALPGARIEAGAGSADEPDHRLHIEESASGFTVRDGELEAGHDELAAALEDAVSRLHFQVAVHARAALFLHAGVVSFEGRLILIPGRTFAGKSTLTMALVEAGGVYYSDEYAPVDREGRVLAYRKTPSLRPGSPVAASGSLEETEPPPRLCDVVLGCRYREGAVWAPERLTDGQGALLLVANAVAARTRSGETARAVASVMRTAVAYRTDRPTAAVAVEGIRRLLADLRQPALVGGAP